MATDFYLPRRSDMSVADMDPPGNMSSDLDGLLSLTRYGGLSGAWFANTAAGPTAGIQMQDGGTTNVSWWTKPLNSVTISGTVTLNLWMAESSMSANVGAQVIIDRVGGSGTFISTILNSEKGTELPVTTRAAQNWTGSPTSTTLSTGDRIRLRVLGNDIGTMASGHTFTLSGGAASGGVDGDSWIRFTETVTESVAGKAGLFRPHRYHLIRR